MGKREHLCTEFQLVLMVKNLPAMQETWEMWAWPLPGLGRSPGEGHGDSLQYSCLDNTTDREAWQAVVHRVAKSRTQLKWLSMFTVDGSVNWYHYGKQYGDSSNIKRRSTIWPTNLTSWFISKGMMLFNVYCSFIYDNQDMETTQMSVNEWMDKESLVYV